MELTVLGSGTAVPHPKRSSAGFWLGTTGGTVMLDLSSSSPLRMAQEGLDWPNLDAIWISHFHTDHCAGLSPFLFATHAAPETIERTKPLRILGAPGLRRLVEHLDIASGNKLLHQPFPVDIIEIAPLEPFQILPNVEAVAYSTPHTTDSHAIHVRDGDSTLVYTSDTGFDEALATFARRVDLFVVESSFVKNKPVEKHLELAETIRLVRMAEPVRALITHFYAEWDDVDFAAEVRKLEPRCEVIQAFDGLRLAVN